MIRHTALFQWAADATDEQKQAAATEVAKLPSIVPSIRAFASALDRSAFCFASASSLCSRSMRFWAFASKRATRSSVSRFVLSICTAASALDCFALSFAWASSSCKRTTRLGLGLLARVPVRLLLDSLDPRSSFGA